MGELETNIETIIHYAEQIEALVNFLSSVKAIDHKLIKEDGAVWSVIEHLTCDMKNEIDEFEAGVVQQHQVARKAAGL